MSKPRSPQDILPEDTSIAVNDTSLSAEDERVLALGIYLRSRFSERHIQDHNIKFYNDVDYDPKAQTYSLGFSRVIKPKMGNPAQTQVLETSFSTFDCVHKALKNETEQSIIAEARRIANEAALFAAKFRGFKQYQNEIGQLDRTVENLLDALNEDPEINIDNAEFIRKKLSLLQDKIDDIAKKINPKELADDTIKKLKKSITTLSDRTKLLYPEEEYHHVVQQRHAKRKAFEHDTELTHAEHTALVGETAERIREGAEIMHHPELVGYESPDVGPLPYFPIITDFVQGTLAIYQGIKAFADKHTPQRDLRKYGGLTLGAIYTAGGILGSLFLATVVTGAAIPVVIAALPAMAFWGTYLKHRLIISELKEKNVAAENAKNDVAKAIYGTNDGMQLGMVTLTAQARGDLQRLLAEFNVPLSQFSPFIEVAPKAKSMLFDVAKANAKDIPVYVLKDAKTLLSEIDKIKDIRRYLLKERAFLLKSEHDRHHPNVVKINQALEQTDGYLTKLSSVSLLMLQHKQLERNIANNQAALDRYKTRNIFTIINIVAASLVFTAAVALLIFPPTSFAIMGAVASGLIIGAVTIGGAGTFAAIGNAIRNWWHGRDKNQQQVAVSDAIANPGSHLRLATEPRATHASSEPESTMALNKDKTVVTKPLRNIEGSEKHMFSRMGVPASSAANATSEKNSRTLAPNSEEAAKKALLVGKPIKEEHDDREGEGERRGGAHPKYSNHS